MPGPELGTGGTAVSKSILTELWPGEQALLKSYKNKCV